MPHDGDLRNAQDSDSEVSATSGSASDSRGTSQSFVSSDDTGRQETRQWGFGFMDHEGQQAAAVYQSLRMSHEHRRRRLFSQRRLAHPETARVGDSNAFFFRPEYLAEDDAVLLQTFSNSDFFERLLEAVRTSRLTGSVRDDTAILDEIFYKANPLFRKKYAILMKSNQLGGDDQGPDGTNLSQINEYVEEHASAQSMTNSWQSVPIRTRVAREGNVSLSAKGQRSATKRQREDKKASSTSMGLVAQSMQQWEKHLEEELVVEGETIDSFRQGKNKTSYIEKEEFQRAAQWNEFLRERALEEQQRELAMKRAIRRKEVGP
ncbi:unnamed protein product [Phytomonas sp. Hart1]|nr:unnamed protein product [Phytomonas sp. Hart1]|eukprot:CCW72186.1 unnamed protein product [Phytomonas sp. isolate Hart1]